MLTSEMGGLGIPQAVHSLINLALPISPFPRIAPNCDVFQMMLTRVGLRAGNTMMTQVIGDSSLSLIEKATLVTQIQIAKPALTSDLVLKMLF